jgi:DNA polymerase sigma
MSMPIQIELSWSNPIGIYKTELLAEYSRIDDRVRKLVLFVKHWSKARNLSNTRRGGMGSFAWSLICICFLMKVTEPPVVPNLQALAVTTHYFQGYNVAFSKDIGGPNLWSTNAKVCQTL